MRRVLILSTLLVPTLLGPGFVVAEELSPEVRRRVDRLALEVPAETVRESTRRGSAGLVAWLANGAPLDPDDEVRRLTALHHEITSEFEPLPEPESVVRILEALNEALPRSTRRTVDGESFAAVLLDTADARAFCRGGRCVYVTRGMLESRNGEPEARVAFVLAQRIGHTVLGHAARDARVERFGMAAASDAETVIGTIAGNVATDRINAWLPRAIDPNDQRDADLFALHLCRNAGFDVEAALDELRAPLVALSIDDDEHLAQWRRLARLRREIDGTLDPDRYGLFRYDPPSAEWTRAEDRSVAGRSVLFVHGMESGTSVWSELRTALAESDSGNETTFLAFVHPNDGSLWSAGRALSREIDRVVREPDRMDIVAHSAGGLVTRVHTDLERGRFRRVVLLGTPHGGSNLANLRVWIEAAKFAGNLRLGYPTALQETLLDGEGQMTIDLRPDSLFLAHLAAADVPDSVRSRFTNVRGRRWGRGAAFGMRTAWVAARRLIRGRIAETDTRPELRDLALERLDELSLPPEITAGDLAVSLRSAHLSGATEFDVPLDHMSLARDPAIAEIVREALFEEPQR